MRDYLILNGINSNTIPGLLISTLPPISKPLIRTNVEEIDGRDGDIVTTLGYSAYDKQFDIGLYGNYDINEIIKYFNSKGIVVFSNEPDKYYNYQILEQIDFEKLIRFKTATVTMHIQPFKYLVDEQPIEENATEISDEGKNITLNNTNDGFLFNDLKVKGDTEQATRSGINLLNPGKLVVASPFISMNENNVLTVEINDTGFFKTAFDNLNLPAGNYTIYAEILSGTYTGGNLCFFDLDNTQLSAEFNFARTDLYPNHVRNINATNGINQLKFYRPFCSTETKIKLWIVQGTYSTMPDYEQFGASPSPEFPSEINNVSNTINIKVQNKNQIPTNKVLWESGHYASDGTKADFATRMRTTNLIPFKASTTYSVLNSTFIIREYDKSGNFINSIGAVNDGETFTTNSNTAYLGISVDITYSNYVENTNQIAIFLNSITNKSWVAHQEQVVNLTLPEGMELCKIGDYQDYIYKENGNWYKYEAIGKVVLDGSESWINKNITDNNLLFSTEKIDTLIKKTINNAFSNYFKNITALWDNDKIGFAISNLAASLRFRIPATLLSDISTKAKAQESFQSWLSAHNTLVYYILVTPVITQITDTTLLEQLEALETLYSYDNITHINSDGNLAPIVFAKINTIENEQIITNEGNYFAKPKITIYGKGAIGINIDGLQVLSVELSSDEIDHITIDSSAMEAYTDNINTLRNRAVTGDYNNLKFNPGDNVISFSDAIEGYIIENYTRWL